MKEVQPKTPRSTYYPLSEASYTPVSRSSALAMRGMCSRLVLAWRMYRKTAPPTSATPANVPPTIPPMTGPDKPEELLGGVSGPGTVALGLRDVEGVIEGVSVVEGESVPATLRLRVGDTVELGVALGVGDTAAGHAKDNAPEPVELLQPMGYNSSSLGPVQELRLMEGRGPSVRPKKRGGSAREPQEQPQCTERTSRTPTSRTSLSPESPCTRPARPRWR